MTFIVVSWTEGVYQRMMIVSLYFRDTFVHKIGIRIISKIYPGLGIIQNPLNRASYL